MGRFGQSFSLAAIFTALLALQDPAAGETLYPTFELLEPEDAGDHRWACRGRTPLDNSESYYELHLGVSSVADCQAKCVAIAPRCVGIEYSRANNGRCEVWTRSAGIEAVASPNIPGDFICIRYGWPVNENLVWAEGGTGRVCRGDSSTDKQNEYFLLVSSETLQGCKGRCAAAKVCYGLSYHQASGRCELWTRPVRATAPLTGFTCLRFDVALALPADWPAAPPTAPPTTAPTTKAPATTAGTGPTSTTRTRTTSTLTTQTTTVTKTPCSDLGRDCGSANLDWMEPGTCVLKAVTGGDACNAFCGSFNMNCTHGGPATGTRSCERVSNEDNPDSCSRPLLVQICACSFHPATMR